MRTITALVGIVLLSGCFSPEKAKRAVFYANSRHPEAVASACSQLYPPKDSIHTETKYLPGQVQYLPGDTVTVNCDSVIKSGGIPPLYGKPRLVRVPCPPCPYRVDTFKSIEYKQTENTAKVTALEKQTVRLEHENSALKWWAIVATIAAIILLTALLKRK
ncbi:MAG: hypothetical protein EOP56_09505 [Sphingobacteriales bacterium]|nr:MAG: hypothetical protein EOP56_09505 [Sphingobacteriales bacterium]